MALWGFPLVRSVHWRSPVRESPGWCLGGVDWERLLIAVVEWKWTTYIYSTISCMLSDILWSSDFFSPAKDKNEEKQRRSRWIQDLARWPFLSAGRPSLTHLNRQAPLRLGIKITRHVLVDPLIHFQSRVNHLVRLDMDENLFPKMRVSKLIRSLHTWTRYEPPVVWYRWSWTGFGDS